MKIKQLCSSVLLSMFAMPICLASGLVSLSDEELSDTQGQALFNLSYLAPTDVGNLMTGRSTDSVGFYKLGLEAEVQLNANIKSLQLGCGGINGAGACDIDISNLSLSGLNDGVVVGGANPNEGSPTFSNGRPATSAILNNPFIEFAIKNPNSASTREIMGFRSSAESITGLLTAGLVNSAIPSATDGIQSLSGFMRIAATTGDVTTQSTLFGKQADHQVSGLLNALGFDRTFTSEPGSSDTNGVTVPSINAGFNMPAFQVNGNRQTTAVANNVTTNIPSIALSDGPQNQLKVNFPAILLVATQAKIKLKAGSRVENLNMDITFNQALNMVHNIPLTGTGGYLALQKQALLWPGSYIDPTDSAKTSLATMTKSDIAQRGWWMSFAEPVQLGYLKATSPVDISGVMPQVATLMTNELLKEVNRVYAPIGGAIGTLFGIVLETPDPIIVDLNAATLANPATLTLGNLQLKNQAIVANCYGTLTFC